MTMRNAGLIAALAAGICLSAAPAMAQPTCEARPAAVYFEPGATTFNAQSKAVIDRVAKEAKACGASRVVAEASSGERGKAISEAFASQGVKVVLWETPREPQAAAPQESIRDRSAVLRLDANRGRVG